jgi:hypothetical protein
MSDWVDVRNFNQLMEGYQKSSYDSTWMPGLGDYLQKLIEQNEIIISLLTNINQKDCK